MSKILPKIPEAVASLGSTHDHWLNAARAICTTDTFPKLISRQFKLPSHPGAVFNLAGMTKGAGMIHPNMATLLGVLCTDAPIHHNSISDLLLEAANVSFNKISIDGDTSTNDTLALFANGAAAITNHVISHEKARDTDREIFSDNLNSLAKDLAQLVVRDGEGATKFVTIRVVNALTKRLATQVAVSIARSPLVKTALYGKDANWGRILCAVGNTPSVEEGDIDPALTSVAFVSGKGERLDLLTNGEPRNVDEVIASQFLEKEDLNIEVDLGNQTQGFDSTFWTCDLSHEYVTINGDYRT